MSVHTGMAMPDIEVMFTQQSGYAMPKLGVVERCSATTDYCSSVKRLTSATGRCREVGRM